MNRKSLNTINEEKGNTYNNEYLNHKYVNKKEVAKNIKPVYLEIDANYVKLLESNYKSNDSSKKTMSNLICKIFANNLFYIAYVIYGYIIHIVFLISIICMLFYKNPTICIIYFISFFLTTSLDIVNALLVNKVTVKSKLVSYMGICTLIALIVGSIFIVYINAYSNILYN